VHRLPVAGLIHLFVTYVVWGSTYLAIRVAVREGAGWGPFWLGASRILVASAILLTITALLRRRTRPTRDEIGVLVVSGLLLWVAGNGGVNWAEQRTDSGLVALVIGTMPMWVALIEAVLDRRAPSALLMASILSGFAGLTVLVAPLIRDGLEADVLGIVVVLCGTICWGVGSLMLNRRPVGTEPMVTSGWQQLAGGFGSLLAFTSYVYALRLLPTSIVMTHTYVNPVIAVLLGWLVLDERVTPAMVGGMALIIVGVFGVFHDRRRRLAAQTPLARSARI